MGVLYVAPGFQPAGKEIDFGKTQEHKVLVVGGGGREHAIVDALSRSIWVSKIYCAPGNAGIADQAECVPISDHDVEGLLAFAEREHIDLTVVGPEASLSAGIVDRFRAAGRSGAITTPLPAARPSYFNTAGNGLPAT